MTIDTSTFTVNCTGDACTGDVILFTEAVFGGSFRKPKFLGERRIAARIIKDSYGSAKQQHTFTVEVIESDGYDALPVGTKTTRKGRNVYRNGTTRQPWADESDRKATLDDKHQRGDCARAAREERKNGYDFC
ncbi:hypothetical protein [Nitratireductor soli]|uniref:hypothetical protein n=1 Tax=Nitratireductor soli TaxID=1670619 RepID=UPI00065DC6BF|nr:hypothetical protein [Nitratireductor soli]